MPMDDKPNGHDQIIDRMINQTLNDLVKNQIAPFTCQLFRGDALESLTPYASGVLVFVGEQHCIFTASHVVEDMGDNKKTVLPIGEGFVSLVGKACGTELDKDVRLDIAYVVLKPELVMLLKLHGYHFLDGERMLHEEKVLDEPNFCAFGFPTDNNKLKGGKLKPLGMAHFMPCMPDKVYEYYKLDPMHHYVLESKGKGISIKSDQVEKIKAAHYGMSGGGLWYTEIGMDEEDNLVAIAQLIGIMIEFRKGKYECLIANRLEPLLALFRSNDGDLF